MGNPRRERGDIEVWYGSIEGAADVLHELESAAGNSRPRGPAAQIDASEE